MQLIVPIDRLDREPVLAVCGGLEVESTNLGIDFLCCLPVLATSLGNVQPDFLGSQPRDLLRIVLVRDSESLAARVDRFWQVGSSWRRRAWQKRLPLRIRVAGYDQQATGQGNEAFHFRSFAGI